MAIINSYPTATPKGADLLIGTQVPDPNDPNVNEFSTKSFSVTSLGSYIITSNNAITGSGTVNTIAMFTPSTTSIGDSAITQSSDKAITISTSGATGSPVELTVSGTDSKVVVESIIAGDATLELRPNSTSNGAAVFNLGASMSTRHFAWKQQGTEIMRLNGLNGNLGIGTTSAQYKLEVASTSAFRALNTNLTPYFQLFRSGTATFINTFTSGETLTIGAPSANTTNLYVQGTGKFKDGIKDNTDSIGTSGQVLTSTGSGTAWDDATDIVSGAIVKMIPYVTTATPGGSETYSADNNIVKIGWSGGPGTYVINLPSATAIPYRVIRFTTNGTYPAGGAHKVQFTASVGETIDGAAFFEISKAYEGIGIWSTGTEWVVIQAKAH